MTEEKFNNFEVECRKSVFNQQSVTQTFPYLGVALIHIPKTGGTALSVALARGLQTANQWFQKETRGS